MKSSAPYQEFNAYKSYYFYKGNQVISVKFHKKHTLIQKFNSDKPVFINKKQYEDYFPKDHVIEAVYDLNNKIVILYSTWDLNNNNKEQLFAQEIDFEKCVFKGQPQLIVSSEEKILGIDGYGKITLFGDKFITQIAKDKTSFCVKYKKRPKNPFESNTFNDVVINAFDSELNLIYKKTLVSPYPMETKIENIAFLYDKNGAAHFFCRVFEKRDKNAPKTILANYTVQLFTIPKNSEQVIVNKLDSNGKYITNAKIIDTDKDFIICGGFYSNLEIRGENTSNGIFSLKVDTDGKMHSQGFNEFSVEIAKSLNSEKTHKKGTQIDLLTVTDLILDPNENILIVGEEQYYTTRGDFVYGHYEDILITKVNKEGKTEDYKKIQKIQKEGDGKYDLSYKVITFNNSYYFFFLDHLKNINENNSKIEQFKDFGDGYLAFVKLDFANNTIFKKGLFNLSEFNKHGLNLYWHDRIIKLNEESFLLEAYKKDKEDIMIKVNLN